MPDSSTLRERQLEFSRHIRNPAQVAAPEGVEGRRMKIYNDLIYNNIEGFLRGGFPVLCSLYREEDWHRLVRGFVCDSRCESPYFLEISQEFLRYLMEEYTLTPVDPEFMLELAHYEWVELALDVATEEIPVNGVDADGDPVSGVPVISPLVWSLQYKFPVHLIGPGHEPDEAPTEPTFLVVYRDRDDEVQFMESNAATARLLQLLTENESASTGAELLEQLALEMNAASVTSVTEFGARMLRQFQQQSIIAGCQIT